MEGARKNERLKKAAKLSLDNALSLLQTKSENGWKTLVTKRMVKNYPQKQLERQTINLIVVVEGKMEWIF